MQNIKYKNTSSHFTNETCKEKGVKKDHTWGRGPSKGAWSNEFRKRRHYMQEYQLCLVMLMK